MEPTETTDLTLKDQQMADSVSTVSPVTDTATPEPGHFPVAEQLHTEVLEQKYGPIYVQVLRHDNVNEVPSGTERIREARIVDRRNILRTYALTFLTYDKTNSEISAIDDAIRKGGMIGQTFKGAGYEVKKNVIDVFMIDMPPYLKDDFRVEENVPRARIIEPGDSEYVVGDSDDIAVVNRINTELRTAGKNEIKFAETYQAKARITEFYAKANKEGSAPVIYATVLEVYSPDFKDPGDGINDVDRAQINPLTGALQNAGVPADEVWERLDKAAKPDKWAGLIIKYQNAEKASKTAVEEKREEIAKYLETDSMYLKKGEPAQ